MAQHTATQDQETLKEFQEAVNMSAKQLEAWLKTEESRSVGMKSSEDAESTGHQAGRKTVELLHQKKSDYDESDFNHMRRVVSYVHRHLAEKPDGDIEHTRWRYSLKNWGHEPLKDQ